MNRIKLFFGAILLAFTTSAITTIVKKGKPVITEKAGPYTLLPEGGDYHKQWAKIDSLDRKGLPKSALEEVMKIYTSAQKENNGPQVIKSMIYVMKYNSYLQEDDYVTAIAGLEKMAAESQAPQKQMIHSIIAEVYWGYYSSNRWKFMNRTQTVNFKNEDIRTWDLKTISQQITKHYLLSLTNSNLTKTVSIKSYDDILVSYTNTRHLRPSVYDFLAHRAIDFFSGTEFDVTRPAVTFKLENPALFTDLKTFNTLNLSTTDTLSTKFHAIKTLQNLSKFHENDKDTSVIVDLELKRLRFVRNYSVVEEKDTLYYQALQNLFNKYAKHHSAAEISYEIAKWHNDRAVRYNPVISDDFKWENKTAIRICEETMKKYKDAYGSFLCKQLKTNIEQKTLSFRAEDAFVPNEPSKVIITSKNIDKLYFRVIKPGWDFNMSESYDQDQLIKKYKEFKPVHTWEQDMKDDKDFNSHNLEIKIPNLEKGYYVILAATDKDFKTKNQAVAYTGVGVTNISYIERRSYTEENYDITVLHRETGEPLQGVKAQIYEKEYNYTLRKYQVKKAESYTTDENGFFQVKRGNRDYRYFYIDFTYSDDRLNSDQSYYQYRPYNYSKAQTVTYFFTDRAIYRPGQTVHFKGIRLHTADDNKHALATNESANVILYDYNYQKIADLNLTTNEYGTFSGTFTAPTGVINGQMHITDGYGTHYFSVEEYKRPKFEVVFEPVKGSYKLNQTVKVQGNAKAFAGSNVDGASVKYRITRNMYYPYWYYDRYSYYNNSYYYGYNNYAATELKNGELVTDENGNFMIEFTALEDKKAGRGTMKPNFSYTITADVTDINGETHTAATTVNVGPVSMVLSIGVPANIAFSEKEKFVISATNLNYTPVNAKGNIVIHKLKSPETTFIERRWEQPDRHALTKEEHYAAFPGELYENENDRTLWAKGNKVFEMSFDTEKKDSLELKNISSWQPGDYILEAISKDSFGVEVKDIKYFTVYSDQSGPMSLNKPYWSDIIDVNCEPGEKARFMIGTKLTNVKALYEVEHKGKIVEKKWLTLNNEQKLIELPVDESHRGGYSVHVAFTKNNRNYRETFNVYVPFTNKEFDVEFETFRNKILPGSNEEWKLKLKGKKGEKIAAEMLMTMYDASLDEFASNYFSFYPWQSYYATKSWNTSFGFNARNASVYQDEWYTYYSAPGKYYDYLNWFGYQTYYYGYNRYYYDDMDGNYAVRGMREESGAEIAEFEKSADESVDKKEAGNGSFRVNKQAVAGSTAIVDGKFDFGTKDANLANINSPVPADGFIGGKAGEPKDMTKVAARKNMSETAFFFPHLQTDQDGNVIVKFTAPEALTKWKVMGIGHTKDLKIGQITETLQTQKELMVMPNAPRFFRENDKIVFVSKISNLSDKDLEGTAQLFLSDAITTKALDDKFKNNNAQKKFSVKKGQSTSVAWEISIPEGVDAVTYKVVAKAGTFSDGEEVPVPVLTNRMMVTESLPLPIRKKGTKTYTLAKLVNSKSSTTLRNHKLTLEYTSNPAWYAIQALPYMMEYPYECAEQTFSRFYANSIATHVVNSSPKIKAVFQSWQQKSPEAFLSNLQKNQELKELILQETPWVLEAKDESERKKRVALLFDLNRMSNELSSALRKLEQSQSSNGGWPWFPGMEESRYITQHIVTGMGHLDKMGVKNVRDDRRVWNMVVNAVSYLDARVVEDYEYLKRHYPEYKTTQHISYDVIQFMYARSYFKDLPMGKGLKEAMEYYSAQAKKYWLNFNIYAQGMLALAAHRLEIDKLAFDITKSIKEKSITHEELGMYWKDNVAGYSWYESPIETHALMIEMFDEVANDMEAVEELKVWLLKNKQTHDWKTTKATAEACYALLLRGTDVLANDELVEVKLGDMVVDPRQQPDVKVEAGTGYFKTSWSGNDIKPEMGDVTVTKKNDGVAWGALYWQYFEQLDKITTHETPLKLSKKLFLVKNTFAGPVIAPIDETVKLAPGDKVRVRIELRVDRGMEYVHMKDMRASCFEPVNVFSRYKWQDGLGYYESTKDAATNFFFDYLPKGTHVFEYDLFVSHAGDFSNGITTIQCMYAPEFTSHSEGIRVKVEGK